MREIKFRAWHKADSMLYYGDTFFHMLMNGDWYEDSDFIPKVKLNDAGYVFMQYTGLKDKNGVEIYEGDLLAWDNGHSSPVSWAESGFKCMKRPLHRVASDLHVIGNIYENKELLK